MLFSKKQDIIYIYIILYIIFTSLYFTFIYTNDINDIFENLKNMQRA